MKKYRLLIFALIIFSVACFFRFYRLDSTPAGLSVDEIANAYNAHSLATSGRDEYGVALPLYFRSYNDYKPPVTIYSIIPAVFFWGNDVFQVRFAPALFGSLTSLLVFFILLKMGFSRKASFITSIWFAVLPWHVKLSRETLETVEALFFTLLGLAGFIGWRRKKLKIYALAFGLGFGLALWTYHAQKIFIPGLLVFLFFPLRHKLKDWKLPLLVFLIFLVPLLATAILSPEIFSRSNATSIIMDNGLKTQLTMSTSYIHKIYIFMSYWVGRYLSYFDPNYLFWDGLNLTLNGRIDSGLFLIADVISIIFGFIYLVKKHPPFLRLIIFWLIFGLIPASITMDDRHTIRSLIWIFPFVYFYAVFLDYFQKKLILAVYFLAAFVSLLMFSDLYFRKFDVQLGEYYSYGYREISLYACKHQNDYRQILVSEAYGEVAQLTAVPQLYLGFYCGGNPHQYLSMDNRIVIKRPYWKTDYDYPDSLFIAAPWDFPISVVPEESIKEKIYFPNGKLGFVFVHTQPD